MTVWWWWLWWWWYTYNEKCDWTIEDFKECVLWFKRKYLTEIERGRSQRTWNKIEKNTQSKKKPECLKCLITYVWTAYKATLAIQNMRFNKNAWHTSDSTLKLPITTYNIIIWNIHSGLFSLDAINTLENCNKTQLKTMFTLFPLILLLLRLLLQKCCCCCQTICYCWQQFAVAVLTHLIALRLMPGDLFEMLN